MQNNPTRGVKRAHGLSRYQKAGIGFPKQGILTAEKHKRRCAAAAGGCLAKLRRQIKYVRDKFRYVMQVFLRKLWTHTHRMDQSKFYVHSASGSERRDEESPLFCHRKQRGVNLGQLEPVCPTEVHRACVQVLGLSLNGGLPIHPFATLLRQPKATWMLQRAHTRKTFSSVTGTRGLPLRTLNGWLPRVSTL